MNRFGWCLAALAFLSAGCADKVERERLRAELEESRQEVAELKSRLGEGTGQSLPTRYLNYIEELERLAKLRERHIISDLEFANRKTAILTNAANNPTVVPGPTAGTLPRPMTMEEANSQLRALHALFGSGAINNVERDEKKRKILEKTFVLIDLKKDLEMAKALFDEGVINNLDRDLLNKKLLALDPVGK